jgi:DNA repair protein RecO (recombination protein O)
MLHKTKGIVLSTIKYRDTSLICKFYTEQFGIQTYIENGVRSKRAKNKIALFQPLTLLDLVVYRKENSDINRISEMKVTHPFQSIPYDVHKSTIAIFLTEVLSKVLQEEEENVSLFNFMYKSILFLDNQEQAYFNFHLQFLSELTRYLGFASSNARELIDELTPYSNISISPQITVKLDALLNSHIHDPLELNASQRRDLLQLLIKHYQIHSNALKEIKSLPILQEVLS